MNLSPRPRPHAVRLIALLLALPLWLAPAAGARAGDAVLRAGDEVRHLREEVALLHDAAGTLDLAGARAALAAGRFAATDREALNFGYLDGALWLHVRADNRGHPESSWLLVIEYSLLDHVTLYEVDADGDVRERHSGDRLPFDTRSRPLRHFNFDLDLPSGEAVDLFLRVQTESSMQVPLVLARPAAYLADRQGEWLLLGGYYGLIGALMVYNLLLWVAVRDRSFLWYVGYVAVYGTALLALNGIAFQYLWPDSPALANAAVVVSIPLGMALMLQFTRSFLELRRHHRRADAIVRGLMLFALALALAAPFAPYRPIIHAATLLVFVMAPLILACAIASLRRYRPARYFLLAWTALLVGTLVFAAVSLGLLPKTPLTEYSMQIGSAAEMLLLSFALAYRINVLKAENERIQRDAREQLEARVRARTHELDAALGRLESANRKLHDFSRRDGLTGVFNRRHLDAVLGDALADARARRQPLSVLMIDADHFKQVNDRHGHLVGDDCLRLLARIVDRRVSAQGGVLTRYGGEEFVVLLPGCDQDDALALAESVRADVAARPLSCEAGPIAVTVSVGVHTLSADDHAGPAELLRIVDAALYAAKGHGRNRVHIAQA